MVRMVDASLPSPDSSTVRTLCQIRHGVRWICWALREDLPAASPLPGDGPLEDLAGLEHGHGASRIRNGFPRPDGLDRAALALARGKGPEPREHDPAARAEF